VLPLVLLFGQIGGGFGLLCYQCANTDGKVCPYDATTFSSPNHNACITWKLGNGSVILQNLVTASEECTEEKIRFWSRFIDLYYNAYGGSVSCCFTDQCNDGKSTQSDFVQIVNKNQQAQAVIVDSDSAEEWFPGVPVKRAQNGNCEKYYDKISASEWMPDILIPLAYDRASQTKVGVFYTKLGERNNNNDHVIVRLVNRAKQNITMYSIKLFRVGSVSIHVSKLEPQRKGGGFVQQEGKKTSVNKVIEFEEDSPDYQGFWISIKDDVTVSVGKIGEKLINSFANYTDVLREGPSEPYYFGLTTPSGTSASFGVNCDMPGLHFDDTCVTDSDCEEYPETECGERPLNANLDPGTRDIPFREWREEDTLLKSCWCKEGTVRIPESRGCYDPVRKVVTMRDSCFANYHCNHLPNTVCTLDMERPKYNMSCQCIPGHKPFEADPRTGLIEGCAPLTTADKGTIAGCSRQFTIEDREEWVPETIFPMVKDAETTMDVGVFFVSLGPSQRSGNKGDDTAVIRLLDEAKDRKKMLTIKIDRKSGKVALYESKITRNFFFSNENDKEVAKFKDSQMKRRMEEGYVGFWVQYRYQEGYGGTLSVGLNGSPFTPDYAIVKWTDSSTTAIPSLRYIGFTAGDKKSRIKFGSNCVLLNGNIRQTSGESIFPIENSFDPKKSLLAQLEAQSISEQSTPWDFVSTNPSQLNIGFDTLTRQPEQVVLEPVIKSQYLTKLKRLLPTYFNEEGPNEKVLQALDNAYRSY